MKLVFAIPSTDLATNFYLDESDATSTFRTTAAQRRKQLSSHLTRVADGDLILVGEAAGWQGARQSGVAFTSPRHVGMQGTAEPSATAVHDLLANTGMTPRTLLWNAFPIHPHKLNEPRTNRTPTSAELRVGDDALCLAMKKRKVLCVGQHAKKSLERILGTQIPIPTDATESSLAIVVRHPSHGGTTTFKSESRSALRVWNLI